MNRALKMIIIFIFAFLTTMLLYINENMANLVLGTNNFFLQMNEILSDFDIISIIVGVIVYFFYYSVFFNGEKFTKKSIIISLVSIFLAIFIVVGKNLQLKGSFPELSNAIVLFESFIMFIGSYLAFYSILKKIFSFDFSIDVKKNKKIGNGSKNVTFINKIFNWLKKHKYLILFIIIVLCRIPYLIIYYPGNTCGDTLDQLCQLYNRDCSWSKDMVTLVNNNSYLNNHHPLFSTLYLGLFVKVGLIIRNPNYGLFLYSFVQMILSSLFFAYLIYYIKKLNVPEVLCNVIFGIICLGPHFSAFSITIFKDTPQALFSGLYVLFLIQIVRDYSSVFDKNRKILFLVIVMLFTMLFRNNGIITILLSYPLLFILYKNHFKKLLIILLIPITIYISFNQISYRVFNIPRGSKKEMLSIPFMQIARVANKKGNDVFSVHDQEVIDKVIDFKNMGKNYNPGVSDYVKDTYRVGATNRELKEFFKVWYKYLKKYPHIYVGSFINCTYEYFYPYETYTNIFLGFDNRILNNFSREYKVNNLYSARTNFECIFSIVSRLPIIGIIFKVCFYVWFLIGSLVYVLYKKNYKYLIPLAALLAVLLACLASPINGSMRYILPILFSFPLIVGVDYLVYSESK